LHPLVYAFSNENSALLFIFSKNILSLRKPLRERKSIGRIFQLEPALRGGLSGMEAGPPPSSPRINVIPVDYAGQAGPVNSGQAGGPAYPQVDAVGHRPRSGRSTGTGHRSKNRANRMRAADAGPPPPPDDYG